MPARRLRKSWGCLEPDLGLEVFKRSGTLRLSEFVTDSIQVNRRRFMMGVVVSVDIMAGAVGEEVCSGCGC